MTVRDHLDAASRPAGGGRHAAARVVPLLLLVAVAIVGLRGAVPAFHWDGPLRRDWLAVGLAMEVVLAALLAATAARGRRSPPDAVVAAKLRGVLMVVLGAGMAVVAALLLTAAHLPTFGRAPTRRTPPIRRISPRVAHRTPSRTLAHIPVQDILWALLAALLLAAVVLGVRWMLRHRPAAGDRFDVPVDEDGGGEDELREAVQSGQRALRALDDARAAIIACYAAMERSLADAGAERGTAETPDELLSRAMATGLVRGAAAGRLTALFYEARFSSHPMDDADRAAAQRALDELAAELRAPAAAATGATP